MGFIQATIRDSLQHAVVFAQDAPAEPNGFGSDFMWVPLVMIGVLFYFMMIRPERRKRQELDTMVSNLKKNDKIVTIGGIYGTVVTAGKDTDEVTIRVDESTNAKLRVQRSSVKTVLADKDTTKSE